jgi:phosphatidylethanolamine N-methyltransferase
VSRIRLIFGLCRTVTNDLAGIDSDQYQITVVPSELGGNRFHVGEVIRVKWKAPLNHSRKDWIGIYRVCPCPLQLCLPANRGIQVGANKDKSVTKVASMGRWVPVYGDEWDEDVPPGVCTPTMDSQPGEVVFRSGALPWKAGIYEVRRLCVKLIDLTLLALDPLSP